MLKKNLVKTGLFGHSLLFFLPLVTAMKEDPTISFKERKTLHLIWQKVDTLSQPFPGDSCTVVLSAETNNAAAPKIALNKHVSKFVKSFLVKEDEALEKAKKRSASYFTMMDKVFEDYDLPVELKYLAVVESDLKSTAVSKVGAKGLWQFMPGTARDLGLKITSKYDERTYPYKSTVAAAKYLKDLYGQFGDWLLVIAAYNSGPAPVYAAIKKSGSRNFWALQYYLPEESRGHVKRFIGTHYYFEGEGSLVTMTKTETKKYLKELETFTALVKDAETEKDSTSVVALNTLK
jgi:membrane-bound lytic murein transglycosylase D